MTLAAAQELFLAALRARRLRESTLQGYSALFRLWRRHAAEVDLLEFSAWDAAALRS